jgi:hypothetical protein
VAYEEEVTLVAEDGSGVDGVVLVSEFGLLGIGDELSAPELVILDDEKSFVVVATLEADEVEVELPIPGVPSTLLPPSPAVLAKKILFSSFIRNSFEN